MNESALVWYSEHSASRDDPSRYPPGSADMRTPEDKVARCIHRGMPRADASGAIRLESHAAPRKTVRLDVATTATRHVGNGDLRDWSTNPRWQAHTQRPEKNPSRTQRTHDTAGMRGQRRYPFRPRWKEMSFVPAVTFSAPQRASMPR